MRRRSYRHTVKHLVEDFVNAQRSVLDARFEREVLDRFAEMAPGYPECGNRVVVERYTVSKAGGPVCAEVLLRCLRPGSFTKRACTPRKTSSYPAASA